MLSAVILLLAGCRSGIIEQPNPEEPGGGTDTEEITITLSVSVPQSSEPVTRGALSEEEESAISTLDVLVFEKTDQGEILSYHVRGKEVEDSPLDNFFTIKVALSKSSEQYRFVLLANLMNEVKYSGITKNMQKKDVLARIVFDQYMRSFGSSKALPMWGESGLYEVTEELAATGIQSVKMIRSVARVDVGVNFDENDVPQGLGDQLYIRRAIVYDAPDRGMAAPLAENFHPATNITLAPTMPSSFTLVEYEYILDVPDFGFAREIYVPEASKQASKTPVLLIEAYYTAPGAALNTTDLTWYRIDLVNPTDGNTKLDILRNHLYRINITSVTKAGATTPDDALAGDPGLVTSIRVHSEDDIRYVVWNNDHMLGASEIDIQAPASASTGSFSVRTTAPGGWSYIITESDDINSPSINWLTYTNPGQANTFSYTVTANSTLIRRTGYIHFFVDGLVLTVKITQNA